MPVAERAPRRAALARARDAALRLEEAVLAPLRAPRVARLPVRGAVVVDAPREHLALGDFGLDVLLEDVADLDLLRELRSEGLRELVAQLVHLEPPLLARVADLVPDRLERVDDVAHVCLYFFHEAGLRVLDDRVVGRVGAHGRRRALRDARRRRLGREVSHGSARRVYRALQQWSAPNSVICANDARAD